MNHLLQNVYLVSSIIGILISLAMIAQIFTPRKANFFIGLVVLIVAIELLFSWGAKSGYTNTPGAIPYWTLLNYLIIPPSIWLFVKYKTEHNFRFQSWHYLLYLPALVAYVTNFLATKSSVSLIDYPLWLLFTDYLPLLGTLFAISYFWLKYLRLPIPRSDKKAIFSQVKLVMLMLCLSLVCLFWLAFTFIGWKYYAWIEVTLSFLFLGFAFLHLLDNQDLPFLTTQAKNQDFHKYDDKKSLHLMDRRLKQYQYFLRPNLLLKELAAELELPSRYVSFLINHYHRKNYKEFINQYRIETFLNKAQSTEKDSKTLLGLALESGFSSKSTFNQVFKKQMGTSPSEYLSQG